MKRTVPRECDQREGDHEKISPQQAELPPVQSGGSSSVEQTEEWNEDNFISDVLEGIAVPEVGLPPVQLGAGPPVEESKAFSIVAINCLLDAALKLKKNKLNQHDYQQISNEVRAGSGEAKTAAQCKAKLQWLKQYFKGEREPSTWPFFEKVKRLIEATGFRDQWSNNATDALLDAHWTILQPQINSGNPKPRIHWESIATDINSIDDGIGRNGEQCRKKIKSLRRQYHEHKCKNREPSRWVHFEKVKRFVTATGAGGSSSDPSVHKTFEWNKNTTVALLDVHWAYLQLAGIARQLLDVEWETISAMIPDVTGAQCRERIDELIKLYSESDQCKGTSVSGECVDYIKQIERLIVLGYAYTSSHSTVAPGNGP